MCAVSKIGFRGPSLTSSATVAPAYLAPFPFSHVNKCDNSKGMRLPTMFLPSGTSLELIVCIVNRVTVSSLLRCVDSSKRLACLCSVHVTKRYFVLVTKGWSRCMSTGVIRVLITRQRCGLKTLPSLLSHSVRWGVKRRRAARTWRKCYESWKSREYS